MATKKARNKVNKKFPVLFKIIIGIMFLFSLYLIGIAILGIYGVVTTDDLINQIEKENPKKAEELKLRLENNGLGYSENIFKTFAIFGVSIMLAIGIFVFILSLNLFYIKNWARITIIVLSYIFSFFILMGALLGNLYNLIDFAVSIFIGTYLLTNKDVKRIFNQ